MASGHGVSKPDQANHPGRQVGRANYGLSGAMDARASEYDRARSGQMSPDEASRVGIHLPHQGPVQPSATFGTPPRGGFTPADRELHSVLDSESEIHFRRYGR